MARHAGAMKPQKRSIRDFFSAAPRTPPTPETAQAIPPASALSSAPAAARAASPEVQLPLLSPTPANAGLSKRIVSNGQQIVLDSDSEDDSLPDLDWGGLNPETANTTQPVVDRFQPSTFPENAADDLRRPSKKGRTGKKLSSLVVDTALKHAEVERRIQQHKADLERLSEEPTFNQDDISEARLEQAIQDDEDPEKAHRLYLAMQRTNATQTVRVYRFFELASDSDSISVQPRFPMQSLPQTQWAASFRGTHAGQGATCVTR